MISIYSAMIVCLDEAFRKSLLSWRKWLYCFPADAQDFEEEEKGDADTADADTAAANAAAAADDDDDINVKCIKRQSWNLLKLIKRHLHLYILKLHKKCSSWQT